MCKSHCGLALMCCVRHVGGYFGRGSWHRRGFLGGTNGLRILSIRGRPTGNMEDPRSFRKPSVSRLLLFGNSPVLMALSMASAQKILEVKPGLVYVPNSGASPGCKATGSSRTYIPRGVKHSCFDRAAKKPYAVPVSLPRHLPRYIPLTSARQALEYRLLYRVPYLALDGLRTYICMHGSFLSPSAVLTPMSASNLAGTVDHAPFIFVCLGRFIPTGCSRPLFHFVFPLPPPSSRAIPFPNTDDLDLACRALGITRSSSPLIPCTSAIRSLPYVQRHCCTHPRSTTTSTYKYTRTHASLSAVIQVSARPKSQASPTLQVSHHVTFFRSHVLIRGHHLGTLGYPSVFVPVPIGLATTRHPPQHSLLPCCNAVRLDSTCMAIAGRSEQHTLTKHQEAQPTLTFVRIIDIQTLLPLTFPYVAYHLPLRSCELFSNEAALYVHSRAPAT